MTERKKKKPKPLDQIGAAMEIVRLMAEDMRSPRDYEVGDFVVWKSGLKNRRHPERYDMAMVMQIDDPEKCRFSTDISSVFYGEPMNVVLGSVVALSGEESTYVEYRVDGRRIRKITADEIKELNAELNANTTPPGFLEVVKNLFDSVGVVVVDETNQDQSGEAEAPTDRKKLH